MNQMNKDAQSVPETRQNDEVLNVNDSLKRRELDIQEKELDFKKQDAKAKLEIEKRNLIFSSPLMIGFASAIFGIFGTVIGAAWQGYLNFQIERQKFELSIVDEILDPENPEETSKALQFMNDIGIVKSLNKEGINKYANNPKNLPNVRRFLPITRTIRQKIPFAFQDAPLDRLTTANIQCPKDSNTRVWSEHISGAPYLSEFPDDHFVTLGCKNVDGQKVGPWISWYSSGEVIQKGELTDPRNGNFTSWYENGVKAFEVKKVNGWNETLGAWLQDGTSALKNSL